jgi:endoglucanase
MEAPFKGAEVLAYDERTTPTPVIKVNQVAYFSPATRRYAYLGCWAGDAGKLDYAALRSFRVIDEKNGRAALEGELKLRKADAPLSGEDVYEMDLAAVKAGAYHIEVPGLGRSASFGVGGEGIADLYRQTQRAFYHQRCGMALEKPFTDFLKPACHLEVYESGHLVGNPAYKPKPGEKTRKFRGGYHDAADFDVFTYHLRATAQALAAYEAFPEKFKDGDLALPESGNKVPDVLDEAAWALVGYLETQREDGAVPLGRGNDQDAIRDWERNHAGARPPFGLFPPETTSSAEYAAVAAQFARLIAPFDAKRSGEFLASARKAFAWAAANPAGGGEEAGDKAFLAWAAAELYSTCGQSEFHDAFRKLYAGGALTKIHWKLSQFVPTFVWAYLTCKRDVDEKIRGELRTLLIRAADDVVKQTEAPAYRMGAGAKDRGLGWGNGNGGGRYADPCLRAYLLTHDAKYLDAASLNADFQLGANPLSKTFITGMGVRPPEHPQIAAYLYTGPQKTGSTAKGITIYGLSDAKVNWYPQDIPVWRRWRDLGNGGAEVSSEFTITETVGASGMLYGFLHAMEK